MTIRQLRVSLFRVLRRILSPILKSSELPRQWDWSIACEYCLYAQPSIREIAPEYFETGSVQCRICGTKSDLWRAVRAHLTDFISSLDLLWLGARATRFEFEISGGQVKEIDFEEQGVPASAVVLAVNYSPIGTCMPIETHGNESRRRWPTLKIRVIGMPLGAVQLAEAHARIQAFVVWVHEHDDSEPWLMLADALEAAAAGKYLRVLVPAHSAFEISLSRLLRDVFLSAASKKVVNQFLESDLTAFGALNVILPWLCRYSGLPELNADIRGRLNRLRSLRNDVVHEGLTEASIDKREVHELLAAAVFGFEFIRFVRPRVETGLTERRAR